MGERLFDQTKFEALQGKAVGDVAGAIWMLMAYIGDQTGVYRALEEAGPSTHDELAARTGLDARYLLEWLSSNAAAGYVEYDGDSGRFSLSPEQAALLAHEGEPTCMQGFFQAVVSQYATHDQAVETFRSGRGRAWGDHHNCLFCGTDRFFRPGYQMSLLSAWLPALDGVEAKLRAGAKVADIGCGHGSSTVLMAGAFPQSTFHGYDFHAPSIEAARRHAANAGAGNAHFEEATAKALPERGFDLVCIFDALHDMGDPVGAARHVREVLNPNGTFMIVEPIAADTLADNLNPLAASFYGVSTMVCVPTSRAQEVGLALGAQAGERRLTEVLREAGFTRIRRATETPMNMVLEARP